VVGNGKPHHARAFLDEQKFDFPLLVDPELRAYEAAGLKRGLLSSFNLSSAVKALGTLRNGFRQTSTKGDPWQQGGAFVITPDGKTLYSYVSQVAGDHPDLDQVLQALRKNQGKN